MTKRSGRTVRRSGKSRKSVRRSRKSRKYVRRSTRRRSAKKGKVGGGDKWKIRGPAGHLPEEKVSELNKMGKVSQPVIPTGELQSRGKLFKILNERKGTDEAKAKNAAEWTKKENPGSIPDELRKKYYEEHPESLKEYGEKIFI